MNTLHKTARLVVMVALLPLLSPVDRGAAQAPEPPYRLTDMVPVTDGSAMAQLPERERWSCQAEAASGRGIW